MANGCAQIVNCASEYVEFGLPLPTSFYFSIKEHLHWKNESKKDGQLWPEFFERKILSFLQIFVVREKLREKTSEFCQKFWIKSG
jgi:hypothetical protein